MRWMTWLAVGLVVVGGGFLARLGDLTVGYEPTGQAHRYWLEWAPVATWGWLLAAGLILVVAGVALLRYEREPIRPRPPRPEPEPVGDGRTDTYGHPAGQGI